MPYYDYKCTKCRVTFEIQKGMNDILEPKCPECGASSQRIFNLFRTLNHNAGLEQGSSCSSCSSSACSSCSGG